MAGIEPTMLWEATDPDAALQRRFGFGSAAEVEDWLRREAAAHYGIAVAGMERLAISSYNFLAWLRTDEGPLIAKCCGWAMLHPRLVQVAELLVWLEKEGLPVAVPQEANGGARQVMVDRRSLGLLRVVQGELLEASQPEQARAAGTTLARLHRALAAYPQAATLAGAGASGLEASIQTWAAQKGMTAARAEVAQGTQALLASLKGMALPPLPTQLVHHDFRAANLIWDGTQIAAVLDFEELRGGYRVEDLAWAAVHLGTLFHHWGPVPQEVHAVFLDVYRAELALTAEEEAWLPILLQWHGLDLARK